MRWPPWRAPRVTVLIPTYNWATVLPFAIGSVLDQTFRDFELLVIGDGCTDESEAVVARIRDRRVRWINLPRNGGTQVGPNNEGLKRARGRIVAYLGHDDLWLPRHLERMVAALEGTRAALAFARRLTVDAAGLAVEPVGPWMYQPGGWIPPASTVHTLDAARAVGGWRLPEATGAWDPETDLWARITEASGPPACVEEITSIKFPAARRPGIYATRPCHEQQAWLARLRKSADPERELQALAEEPYESSSEDRAVRASWPPELTGERPVSAAERHRVRRLYKGLK